MATVFDSGYANEYDLLYGDKDYEAECDLIEAAIKHYGSNDYHSIVDLGCGTGNHSIPLARRGYKVTGVDLSQDMLSLAGEKARSIHKDSTLSFQYGNVRNVDLGQTFDIALMMFAVLGYQLENQDVFDTLRTVRKHLKPNGLFLFDVWYGPAVLSIRPSDRTKVIKIDDGQLIRLASGTLDTYKHTAEVQYHLWRIQGKQVMSETQERHLMRYFFPQELSFFLASAGMELLNLTAFPSLEVRASETSWNVLGIARPVSL